MATIRKRTLPSPGPIAVDSLGAPTDWKAPVKLFPRRKDTDVYLVRSVAGRQPHLSADSDSTTVAEAAAWLDHCEVQRCKTGRRMERSTPAGLQRLCAPAHHRAEIGIGDKLIARN